MKRMKEDFVNYQSAIAGNIFKKYNDNDDDKTTNINI